MTPVFVVPPLFPIGFEVRINRYFGLVRAGATDRSEVGPPDDITPRIVRSIRFIGETETEWDDTSETYFEVVTYPKKWEYLFVREKTGVEWGWLTEAELIDKGYSIGPLAKALAQADAAERLEVKNAVGPV